MEKSGHELKMTDRKVISLTGVTDVKEFSGNKVNLSTVMGGLTIKGKNLKVSRLNTDTGMFDVSGDIDDIKYTSSAGGGMLEGLFK